MDRYQSLLLFLLLLQPVVTLVLHMMIVRISKLISKFTLPSLLSGVAAAFLGIVLTGGAVLLFCDILSWSLVGIVSSLIYFLLVSLSLAFCYFIFFTMSETARRIHILKYLKNHGGEVLKTEILGKYSTDEMLRSRLARMVELGQLSLDRGSYFLNRRDFFLAAMFVESWRKLLKF